MAYDRVRIKQKDSPLSDGRTRFVFAFLGNAGEAEVDRERYIDGSTTVEELEKWRYVEAQRISARKSLADSMSEGQILSISEPTPPPLTPKQAWDALARRVSTAESLKLTDSKAVTDLTALKDQLNANYRTGFL